MKPQDEEPELLEKKEGLFSRSLLIVLASLAALAVVVYTILTSVRTRLFERGSSGTKKRAPLKGPLLIQ